VRRISLHTSTTVAQYHLTLEANHEGQDHGLPQLGSRYRWDQGSSITCLAERHIRAENRRRVHSRHESGQSSWAAQRAVSSAGAKPKPSTAAGAAAAVAVAGNCDTIGQTGSHHRKIWIQARSQSIQIFKASTGIKGQQILGLGRGYCQPTGHKLPTLLDPNGLDPFQPQRS
jgi:hypothetical protein